MTSTTTTNSTSNQIVYLPTNLSLNYGGVLNSWTTSASTWTQSNLIFDEDGAMILDQVIKMQAFIMKYKALVNGIIYEDLIGKLDSLLDKLNCMWGAGNFVGYSSTPTWSTTIAPTTAWAQTYTSTYTGIV